MRILLSIVLLALSIVHAAGQSEHPWCENNCVAACQQTAGKGYQGSVEQCINHFVCAQYHGKACTDPEALRQWVNQINNGPGVTQKNESQAPPLSISHIRQENNLCVPTSAAMVLKYFGENRSPRELKTLSRGRDYNEKVKFTDFTIDSPS